MSRFDQFEKMLQDRRVGFRMSEVMTGRHEFEPGCGPRGTHPFEFRVDWGPEDVLAWANPTRREFLTQPLEGWVSIGELCERAPCAGTLELRYFTKRTIRYTFAFVADGRDYQYVGEKVNILPWNLPTSHTTCFGTVKELDTGKLISRSVTHFRLKTTFDFVTSFRFA